MNQDVTCSKWLHLAGELLVKYSRIIVAFPRNESILLSDEREGDGYGASAGSVSRLLAKEI